MKTLLSFRAQSRNPGAKHPVNPRDPSTLLGSVQDGIVL
jgi:hypothetical protein